MTNHKKRRARRLARQKVARLLLAPPERRRMTMVKTRTIRFEEIAAAAGFLPGPDGKLNLPARDQGEVNQTAERLRSAVCEEFGNWEPGEPRLDLTITGAGPVWGYLAVAHALHGRCARLTYASPVGSLVIWSHGL